MLLRAVSRFTAFAALDGHDFADLAALSHGIRSVPRGGILSYEGDPSSDLLLLLDGWATSSVTFADGTRQLLKVHLPGDMLGLAGLALTRSPHAIVALQPVTVSLISRPALGRLFMDNPRVAALLFLISQEERAAMMDQMAVIGGTDTRHSFASLLLQIHARVLRNDPSAGDAFDMPLAQDDVADLIGVTTVHFNRTLRSMRSEGLVRWSRQRIMLLDRPALRRLAGLPDRTLATPPDWLPDPRV